MLNFPHTLIVCSSLLLIFPVALGQSGVVVAFVVGIEHLHVKNACCLSHPQKVCADTSSRAPSSLLAVLCLSCSVVTCCKVGSMATLWHTSLRYSAVMFLSSLCLMDGNPPHGQFIACFMLNGFP